jgi:hypothetical protein
VESSLGRSRGWGIEIQEEEDQPAVRFRYPRVRGVVSKYVKPYVLLELVPRSEPVPSGGATIRPYMFNAVGRAFQDPDVRVRHITVSRAFWEKATILHMYYHFPEGKRFGERFSRHYYDTFRLLRTGHFEEALKDLDLLRSVVRHKKRFYRSGPAKYDDAAAGKLCLVPPDARLEVLRADYAAMNEMFFGTPPPFHEIIAALREIEARVNPLMSPKPTE